MSGAPANDNQSNELRPNSRATMIGVRVLFGLAVGLAVAQAIGLFAYVLSLS